MTDQQDGKGKKPLPTTTGTIKEMVSKFAKKQDKKSGNNEKKN